MYPYNYQSYGRYQPQVDIQFVNGKASAEVYAMPPSSRVILMDSEKARFYLKETDAAGLSRITAYDFTEVVEQEPVAGDYITRQEFEEWKVMLNESTTKQVQQSDAHAAIKF